MSTLESPSFAQLDAHARALFKLRAQIEQDARRAVLTAAMHPECKSGPKTEDTLLSDLFVMLRNDVIIAPDSENGTNGERFSNISDRTLSWLMERSYSFWSRLEIEAHEQFALHLRSARLWATNDSFQQPIKVHESFSNQPLADRMSNDLLEAIGLATAVADVRKSTCDLLMTIRPVSVFATLAVGFEPAYSLTNWFKYGRTSPDQ